MSISLADLVDSKQIALNLRARTQAEAMREIVGLLVANGKIDNTERFLNKLQERERTNSTYAADGVAFPHTRTKLVDEIVAAVKRIRDAGMTVLIVEQRIAECLDIADRAYILQTGRLQMQGSADEIKGNPDVRKAYLGL